MSNNRLTTGQEALLVTPVDYTGAVITGAATTLVLGTFKALNNGVGYSTNDIIILRQVGTNASEWYNTNTNTVIAPPLAADLGSVSAATNVTVSSALPTGTNSIGQVTANAGTNLNTSALALESGGNLASINSKFPSGLTVTSTRLLIDGSGVTQPISAASLPLPTGAATESTLTTMLTTTAFQARIPTGLTVSATRLLVDNSGVTQPVSAVSLPLPTGAAISANQVPAFTNSAVNFGAANAANLKSSAGTVYKVYCFNKNAAVRYFQIHNKATTPVNSDVPIESFPIAPNTALVIDSTFWGANGRVCSTGVSWAFSTTEATLTLATASDQSSSVGYA